MKEKPYDYGTLESIFNLARRTKQQLPNALTVHRRKYTKRLDLIYILDLPKILIALLIAMGDSTNGDFTVSSHSLTGFCWVANSHVNSVTPFRNMILLCQRSSHFSNNKQGSACSQPAVSQLITLL